MRPVIDPDPQTNHPLAEHYLHHMDAVIHAANLLRPVDFDFLENTLSQAEAFGPIIDPTAYRTSQLREQRELLQAARNLADTANRIANPR